jgi:hypothetical protein
MGDKNFEEGYGDGQEDATSGEGKSTFKRPVSRLLRPDSFLPGGDNRVESYLNGYSTGFYDGVREISIKSTSNQTEGTSMSGNQTLEYQLELLQELEVYLKSVQDEMDTIRQEYGRRVRELRDAGLIVNHHEFLQRNIFNPTESTLLRFVEHLQNRDLSTVRKEINFVESEIERLGQSFD